jgi:hypothetical protein
VHSFNHHAATAMCTRLSTLHGVAVQYIPFDALLGQIA